MDRKCTSERTEERPGTERKEIQAAQHAMNSFIDTPGPEHSLNQQMKDCDAQVQDHVEQEASLCALVESIHHALPGNADFEATAANSNRSQCARDTDLEETQAGAEYGTQHQSNMTQHDTPGLSARSRAFLLSLADSKCKQRGLLFRHDTHVPRLESRWDVAHRPLQSAVRLDTPRLEQSASVGFLTKPDTEGDWSARTVSDKRSDTLLANSEDRLADEADTARRAKQVSQVSAPARARDRGLKRTSSIDMQRHRNAYWGPDKGTALCCSTKTQVSLSKAYDDKVSKAYVLPLDLTRLETRNALATFQVRSIPSSSSLPIRKARKYIFRQTSLNKAKRLVT